jgi:hypothetical protein
MIRRGHRTSQARQLAAVNTAGVAVEVGEVNVSVNDVHLPSDDDGQEQAPPGPPRVT